MKQVELDEFLVNPIKDGETVLVDANWLQSTIKKANQEALRKSTETQRLDYKIYCLEIALEASRRKLEVASFSCPQVTYSLNVRA